MNTINTNMRNAFIKATAKAYSPVVLSCLHTKAGVKPVGRGWTASLSPRTTKQLVHEGVFA
jgi:fructose/tagatose bisphosphate aldolase